MILNITYSGVSYDFELGDTELDDHDIKRVGLEMIATDPRAVPNREGLRSGVFDHFVVDRFDTPEGGRVLFLRPKVPFGA